MSGDHDHYWGIKDYYYRPSGDNHMPSNIKGNMLGTRLLIITCLTK